MAIKKGYRIYRYKVKIFLPGETFTMTKEDFKEKGNDLLKSKGVFGFYNTIITDPKF